MPQDSFATLASHSSPSHADFNSPTSRLGAAPAPNLERPAAMQKPRRAHKKSRRGCAACKARHVKCDEQGPPCANCAIRNIRCSYVSASTHRQSPSWAIADYSTSSASPIPVRRSPATPSPLGASSSETSDRLLELELMHRWTAHTWHGLYNLPTCQAFLQENLPREGLRLSFILHGIMALAALDAALLAPREDHALVRRYKRAALEYYTRASAEFRDVMKSAVVTRDTLYLLSMFGNIAGFFNLAISDDDNNGSGDGFAAKSAIDRVHDSFVMFLGSIHTAAMNWTWFFGGATSARLAVEEYYPRLEYMELIDVDTMAAIQRLSTVCRAIRLRPTGDPALDSDGQGPISYDVWSYRIAVGQTKYCFAEHVVGRIKGFMVNLPTRCVCGPEIADGLRTREPMAMFILLYWGVLLHGCAGDPWLWWAGTIGRDVVVETSEILARSPAFELEDVREGIAWARKQVGLEAMAQVAG